MRSAAFIVAVFPFLIAAQTPQASLDTAIVRIGEQALLTISIITPSGTKVEWPAVGDTLQRHIEVISVAPVDTTSLSDGTQLLSQRIKITSFDTGYWAIAPFTLRIAGGNGSTHPLLLTVRPVDLGEEPAPKDIRPIHEAPFDLIFWMRRNWYWILGVLLIIAAIILVPRWLKNRPRRTEETSIPARETPLHELMLARLRSIEADRLWQQGLHKEYHSRITDLLREYIELRYRIPALERTTDELVRELRLSPLTGEQQMMLRNMLMLADMVKFAKAVPSPEENEQMLAGAIGLIQATALTPRPAHA